MSAGAADIALRHLRACSWPYKYIWITKKQVGEMQKAALAKHLRSSPTSIQDVVVLLCCGPSAPVVMDAVAGLGVPSSWPKDPLGAAVSLTVLSSNSSNVSSVNLATGELTHPFHCLTCLD